MSEPAGLGNRAAIVAAIKEFGERPFSVDDLARVTDYDATGRVAQVTDHTSRIAHYTYDELGRQVIVIQNYQDGTYDPSQPDQDLTSLTVYDETTGQVAARVQVADERITTTYGYDAAGRLVTTTNALSGTTVTRRTISSGARPV